MDAMLFCLGSISAAIAVFVGGARAHLLENRLPPHRLPMLEVGMRYQLSHSIGILFCALVVERTPGVLADVAAWVFVAGIVIFCLSMYTYALTGYRPIMRLTPLGGLVFLVGWVCLGLSPWW